jgi:hypothetical protein
VSFESGIALFNHLPFAGAFRPQLLSSQRIVMTRWPDIGCNILLVISLFLFILWCLNR